MHRDNPRFRTHTRLFIAIICSLLIIGSSVLLLIVHNAPGPKSSTLPGSSTTLTHHATATPTSTPTPSPTSAGTETITPLPTPIFSDNFSNNSQDWYINTSTGGYIRSLTAEGLVLTDTNHNPMIESLPTSHKFDDFTLNTTLTLKKGDNNDSTGIYLRGDSNLDHDYRIDIFGDNLYAISKEYLDTNDTPQTLYIVPPSSAPSLKPRGDLNTLTIIMKSSALFLLINGKFVNSIIDEDYTHGQIALFVANGATSSGVTAVFSSIEIISAPSDQFPLIGGCVTVTPTLLSTATVTPTLAPCSGTCAISTTEPGGATPIDCR